LVVRLAGGAFLERRVFLKLLRDHLLELDARELQQLDCLLQLRRHHQLLREPLYLSDL
jgi:hypothetical protein